MIVVTGKLTGFDELEKKLTALPGNIENKILQNSVTAAMFQAEPDIIAAMPDSEGPQSAASKKYGTAKQNIRVMKLRNVKRGQKGARIDTGNAFWIFFYELGTRHQPARPVFAPAFRAAVDKILGYLADDLGAGIEKIAGE